MSSQEVAEIRKPEDLRLRDRWRLYRCSSGTMGGRSSGDEAGGKAPPPFPLRRGGAVTPHSFQYRVGPGLVYVLLLGAEGWKTRPGGFQGPLSHWLLPCLHLFPTWPSLTGSRGHGYGGATGNLAKLLHPGGRGP